MTPFVGENFNVTKAGIHADGLMKDEEIYNIFNTKKLLNRAPGVSVSKTSGLAGIAYWMNEHYELLGDEPHDQGQSGRGSPQGLGGRNVRRRQNHQPFQSGKWRTKYLS